MTDTVTTAQMRDLEGAAMAAGTVTGLALMERAGVGVVDALLSHWPELADGPQRAVVLCGPGNNGGDGFVVARLLKRAGWDVDVFLQGDAASLPSDARANHDRWCEIGSLAPLTQATLMAYVQTLAAGPSAVVPVIDALFGIGQRAPLDAVLAPVNAMIDAWFDGQGGASTPVFVSVDVPTGYDADTGAALARRPLPADLIVTFHARKPIHNMPHMQGTPTKVVDIGL